MGVIHYHCPYCKAMIEHKPALAGERVQCSKCQGAYYEPTDRGYEAELQQRLLEIKKQLRGNSDD